MSDLPRNPTLMRRDFSPPGTRASLSPHLRRAMPPLQKRDRRGLRLTSVLCLLVWSGYNTHIYYCLDPLFPNGLMNFVHGVRAFFPMLAGVIATAQLAQHRSLPKWLAFGPLPLLLLYAGIGSISSLFVSSDPIGAVYWALQYVSLIVVVMAIASGSEPEAHLARYISVNWPVARPFAWVCLGGFPCRARRRSVKRPLAHWGWWLMVDPK